MAGRGKAGSFPRRTSWKTRGGGRGGHLPTRPGISGTLAGDAVAGADGLFAQVRARRPHGSLDNPGFWGPVTGPWPLRFSFSGEGLV